MPLLEDLYQKQRARQVELPPFFYSTAFLASAVAAGATGVTVHQHQFRFPFHRALFQHHGLHGRAGGGRGHTAAVDTVPGHWKRPHGV